MADWYWAARRDGAAMDAFVIEDGQEALWRRVRSELDVDGKCAWNPVHQGSSEPTLSDILNMMFTVVPTYRVNHNRFVFEAAKIPVFAKFLYAAPSGLANYVSNTAFPEALPLEAYSPEATRRLGEIVSETLGIEADWFEY